MQMYDIILKKRGGSELSDREISFFIEGYTKGEIPDYQASALMMAIFFKGMSKRETVTLTQCMAHSGDTVDLSRFGTLSVDKHSTGGVGDKTSLIVAPIVAALGGKVSKMSGRGLGHTGGTVDKLESVPGYRTTLSEEEFLSQVDRIGLALIGQSGNLTPADKKLYALRDVTATVDSIPLITSSIMSKKLAAGSHNIVLDVKVGSGAFMKNETDAEELATQMVDIGKSCGRNIAAVLTNMDIPLGNAVGNALEVKEAIEVLRGDKKGDLYEVCITLATQMISLTFGADEKEAGEKVLSALESGAAFEKMKQWIAAQGGDVSYVEDPSRFPESKFSFDVSSDRSGYVTAMDAETIGSIGVLLGAGRASKEDTIDHAAGILLHKKVGDRVEKGEVLCTLYTDRASVQENATERYLAALTIKPTPPERAPLVYKIIR